LVQIFLGGNESKGGGGLMRFFSKVLIKTEFLRPLPGRGCGRINIGGYIWRPKFGRED